MPIALAILAPATLAFVFGFFAFRSRIKGVYFSIITQALTYAMMLLFFRNETGFGGNNGFTDFKRILDYPLATPTTRMILFMLTGACLLALLLVSRFIVTSKFGRVLTAIREAESRVMFCGYDTLSYKLAIWTFSAAICGLAGALYVPQVGIINPSEMSPAASIEIAIWAAVGGRGTLIGPLIGAFLVNGAKSFFTAAIPEYWLFFLGLLFVLVTLLLPKGVIGLFDTLAPSPQGARAMIDEPRHLQRRRALSRRCAGHFRRLSRAARPVAVDRHGRAALHHRPQWRRQDDDDGRHHRQDAAGYRQPSISAARSISPR